MLCTTRKLGGGLSRRFFQSMSAQSNTSDASAGLLNGSLTTSGNFQRQGVSSFKNLSFSVVSNSNLLEPSPHDIIKLTTSCTVSLVLGSEDTESKSSLYFFIVTALCKDLKKLIVFLLSFFS